MVDKDWVNERQCALSIRIRITPSLLRLLVNIPSIVLTAPIVCRFDVNYTDSRKNDVGDNNAAHQIY